MGAGSELLLLCELIKGSLRGRECIALLKIAHQRNETSIDRTRQQIFELTAPVSTAAACLFPHEPGRVFRFS